MAQRNLTEKYVASLKPTDKRYQVRDLKQPGFCVRVDPSGRISFAWYAKVAGVPRFRALGEFPRTTVDEARDEAKVWESKAAEWKRSRFQGPDPFAKEPVTQPAKDSTAPPFSQLIDAYIEGHVRTKEPASPEEAEKIVRAEKNVRWMAKFYFSDWTERPITDIGLKDVLAVKNALGKKHYAANRCVEFAKAIFGWAAAQRDGKVNFWPVSNPAKGVELHEETKRKIFLQPDELVRFSAALEDEPSQDLRDFLILALATGARKSTIYGMRWENVEWERAVWSVPYSKGGEQYDVQLLPAALGVLKRRRAAADKAEDTSEFVFPADSASGHIVGVNKPWYKFRVRAQIQHIRMHDLRRTVASYQAISGVSLQQIGASLGHKSMQSTQVYARLHDEAVRDARQSGQTKMREMMRAAERRQKKSIAGRKTQKALPPKASRLLSK